MTDIVFYSGFINATTKIGATGPPTPSCTIWSVLKASPNTVAMVVNAQDMTEIARGLWFYPYAGADIDLYDYVGVSLKDSADVVYKEQHFLRWDAAERITLAAIAAAVWTYVTRTLTQTAASIIAAISGDRISDIKGNTWAIPLTLNYDITGLKVEIALKVNKSDEDEESVQFIDTVTGLLVINGTPATVAENSKGSISVVDLVTGAIIWNVDADITASHERAKVYGIQVIEADDSVVENWGGTFELTEDVVKAVD